MGTAEHHPRFLDLSRGVNVIISAEVNKANSIQDISSSFLPPELDILLIRGCGEGITKVNTAMPALLTFEIFWWYIWPSTNFDGHCTTISDPKKDQERRTHALLTPHMHSGVVFRAIIPGSAPVFD